MTTAIVDGTNIDMSVFSYSAPKANPAGGKVVNLLNKHAKESLTIAVPLMGSWGAQESKEVVGKDATGKAITKGTGKYTMSLQFAKGQYTTPDADAFLEQMKAVEQKIKQDAMIYSKEWFGKEIKSMEVMEEKFNVMLRYPKIEKGKEEMDYTKAPTMTVKLPCWSGKWQPEIYDEDGNPLFLKTDNLTGKSPLPFLAPKTHVICLIQCGGLWFVNGKVSITWNLKQAIVQKPKTSAIAEGTCFLKPKAADKEKLKSLPPPEEAIMDDGPAVASTIVEDDDEYIPAPAPVVQKAPEPQKVEEPEPAKVEEAPKKKTVIKKKAA